MKQWDNWKELHNFGSTRFSYTVTVLQLIFDIDLQYRNQVSLLEETLWISTTDLQPTKPNRYWHNGLKLKLSCTECLLYFQLYRAFDCFCNMVLMFIYCRYISIASREISVGTVAGWMARVWFLVGTRFFSSPQHSDWFLGFTQPSVQ
jgi:hypothetical protein